MKEERKHIDESLLLKILDNSVDEKEKNLFKRWYNDTEENAKYFEQLKKVNQLLSIDKNSIQKNWNVVLKKYESGKDTPDYIELPDFKPRIKVLSLKLFIQIAAILVVLIGISVLFKNIVFNPKQLLVSGEDLNQNEPYLLNDGSLVYLNGKSSISFSNKFGSKNRDLTLSGEAFFEVTPNKQIPFVITTKNTNVKVVGTRFNVFSDQSELVQIVVVEGVVEFYSGEKENLVTLNAGEQGTYSPSTGAIKKEEISNANFISWKTGVLYFNETPLQEAIKLLNNHYSRVLVFENKHETPLTLTTTFDNQPLEDVLEELNLLLNTNYVSRNDTIIFKENN